MVAVQGYSLMRTRSGMIVIRLATWRPLLRATSWVTSANFVITEFSEVHSSAHQNCNHLAWFEIRPIVGGGRMNPR
jgi:hypothetical protein